MTGFNEESMTWKAANWIHGLPDQSATTFDVMQKFEVSRMTATEIMNAIRKSDRLYTCEMEHLDNPSEGRRLTVTAIGSPGTRIHPHGEAAHQRTRKEVEVGRKAFALMQKPRR